MHIETYLQDEIIHHVQSEGKPEGSCHMMTDIMKKKKYHSVYPSKINAL